MKSNLLKLAVISLCIASLPFTASAESCKVTLERQDSAKAGQENAFINASNSDCIPPEGVGFAFAQLVNNLPAPVAVPCHLVGEETVECIGYTPSIKSGSSQVVRTAAQLDSIENNSPVMKESMQK